MAQPLVEGWTERIRYQLGADGAAPNITGMTCVLLLYKRDKTLQEVVVAPGDVRNYAGTSGIETAATGIVFFDPAAGDLVAANSPYYVRWRVTDGAGDISFFPHASAEVWQVRKP